MHMPHQPTNRAVAAAAQVSTGTVSNVLHRPHAVAGETRKRVERAMLELGFQQDGRPARRRRWHPEAGQGRTAARERQDASVRDPEQAPDLGIHSYLHGFPLHGKVVVLRDGTVMGSGLFECPMQDGSGAWVRFDDGRGRILLTRDEGYEIRLAAVAR